jgi:glycosyltransferase involved in cell wall biosynthesis
MSNLSSIERLVPSVSRQTALDAHANQVNATVAILMCTCNGQDFLEQQLQSFVAQSHCAWKVVASDDASIDNTRSILQRYQEAWGEDKLTVCTGPGKGFAANFLSLVCKADISADYFAYSDQDDIWEPAKLKLAVDWLQSVPSHVPALYCSRTRLVDEANRGIGLSPLFSKPPCFANALMQNIGGGNTMVFNLAARRLLQEAGDQIEVVTHDWWTYLVVAACGGKVFYDARPTVRYRQHSANIIGMNSNWAARFLRLHMMIRGRFKDWSDIHVNALSKMAHMLTPENRELLALFCMARQGHFLPRMIGLKRTGVFRQTKLSQLGLIAAAVFKKI